MTNRVQTIAAEAAELERQERVAIIEKLLESLEPEPADHPLEAAKAWRSEVNRRSMELKNGAAKAVPWDQVKADGERLFDAD
jgi:putative addiction module component (TIGR02574 family)